MNWILVSLLFFLVSLFACHNKSLHEEENLLQQKDLKLYIQMDSGGKSKRFPAVSMETLQSVPLPSPDSLWITGEQSVSAGPPIRILMRSENHPQQYWIVYMDATTKFPVSIDFRPAGTSRNQEIIIRYLFEPQTGELQEYNFQIVANHQDWETVTHELLDNQIFVYDSRSLKKEKKADEKQKEIVRQQAYFIRDLFQKLLFYSVHSSTNA